MKNNEITSVYDKKIGRALPIFLIMINYGKNEFYKWNCLHGLPNISPLLFMII